MEAVGGAGGEQGHVAATGDDLAHARAAGLAFEGPVALGGGVGRLLVAHLGQLDPDLAVHDQGELVMGAGPPVRGALGPDRLQDVLPVLTDRDLLVRPGPRGDLEHVGERVVVGLVVDDLDMSLLVVVK